MINEKIEKAFNEQIKHELESAYLYLAMASYFHHEGWDGMAAWMKKQAVEEEKHAMRFFEHIVDRGGRVHLAALSQPKAEWSGPTDAWDAAYKHEQFITSRIHALSKLAEEEKDYTARPMLDWFLNEQIEEEAQTQQVLTKAQKTGNSAGGLMVLDHHLGKREE